jgi:hypothetical protein
MAAMPEFRKPSSIAGRISASFYALADNKLALNAGWDEALLALSHLLMRFRNNAPACSDACRVRQITAAFRRS